MNRRGNAVVDTALILALIFTLVMTAIILKFSVIDPLNTDIQADPEYSAQAKTISASNAADFSSTWDIAIPFLLAFLWMAALISSQFIDTKPVFFVFSVIGILVLLLVAMSLEQAYEDTIADAAYSGFETSFPKTHLLMQNIVAVVIFMSFSVGVALYAKQ